LLLLRFKKGLTPVLVYVEVLRSISDVFAHVNNDTCNNGFAAKQRWFIGRGMWDKVNTVQMDV
jgi:hypothetical protein